MATKTTTTKSPKLASNQVNIGTKDKPNVITSGGSGSGGSSAPVYNSATGKNTGKPSAEYDAYLRGLTKATPNDDSAIRASDKANNDAIATGATPEQAKQIAQGQVPTVPTTPQVQGQTSQAVTSPTTIPTGQQADQGNLNQYQQGFQNATASGATVPQQPGDARAAAANFTPPQSPDYSPIDSALAADEGYQELLALEKDYKKWENQQTSMVDEYKKMTKAAGLQELNTELINMKNVIEGTEEDIRNEVQATAGFATESQVLALAASRNKQLIKNYNTLLDTYNSQKDYVTTMMGLQAQDRQLAQQSLQNRLQFQTQQMQFRDKFVQNAQESYKNIITLAGADGFYNSIKNDPYTLNLASKVLGVSPSMLQQAASSASTKRAQEQQLYNLDVQSKRASIAADYAKMSAPKELTQPQATAFGYGKRTLESGNIINQVGDKFANKPSASLPFGLGGLSALKSKDAQKFEQAKRNFINAVLRRESGASISPAEFSSANKQYFPQYGDSPEVLEQKRTNRNQTIQGILYEGGQGYVDPSRLTISPYGELIEIVD